ncbi:DM13 domain-containing protein [uncultured Ferrimonas sp.]|uniref:DM13 domain-containing protein n=1 Tax=uncultured Ferrimonas sp. TaxID=432640 RepID=UPI00263653A0|nr:DM13 domain-containing protein [uncultured Ferrimonas sp.]
MKTLLLWLSHGLTLLLGIGLGIYLLPLLTAAPAPTATVMQALQQPLAQAQFDRDRRDSDWLHWGEGKLLIGNNGIGFEGELAPGPDYWLYLSPQFVETEQQFNQLKPQMVAIGMVRGFDGFYLPLDPNIDLSRYHAAVIWCESFGQFITSGLILPHQND